MMRRVLAVVVAWAALLGSAAWANPPSWSDLPDDPAAAIAQWEQTNRPALRERQDTARARIAAAEDYFSGSIPLQQAFPGLADLRLSDPAVLSARRIALDDAAVHRAADRLNQPEALADQRRIDDAVRLARGVFDAEDEAAEQERRLLLALHARLERWPAETAASVDALSAELVEWESEVRQRLEADPTNEDAMRQLALIGAETTRWRTLERSLQRRATVPGASLPVVADEVARLQAADERLAWQADARLSLCAPHLTAQGRADVSAARTRFRSERVLPALQAREADTVDGVPTLPESEEELVAALQQLQPYQPTNDPSLGADAAQVQAQIDALRASWVERQRTALQAAITAKDEAEALSEGDEARQSRQVALDQAERAESERLAELLTAVADANSRAALAHDRVSNLAEWGARQAAAREERLERLDALVTEAVDGASALLYAAGPEPDTAYEGARSEIDTLRQEALHHMWLEAKASDAVVSALAAIEQDRARLGAFSAEASTAVDRVTREEALGRWRTALFDEIDAIESRGEEAAAQTEAVLLSLRQVKAAKRSLAGWVSPEQRRLDWQALVNDLRWERALVWPAFLAIVREQLGAVLSAPLKLFNPVYVSAFVRSGFWLFALLAVWYWVRARADRFARNLIGRVAVRRPGRHTLFTLHPEVTRTVRAVLDLAIGWLLRPSLVAFLPILGFAVWVYLQVAMYRLAVALFDLLVEPYGAQRPSLLALGPKAHRLARHSLRWLALWVISRDFARQILQGVLDADGLDIVTRIGMDVVGVMGCLWLLHRWAPVLRQQIASFHHESRWVRFLSRPPRFAFLNAPWALVTGVYLTLAWGWDRTQELARQREGFGRLLATVTRFRLPQEEEHTQAAAPLPESVLSVFYDRSKHFSEYVERPADATLVTNYAGWKADRLSGLTVVCGEPGEGKDDYLKRVVPTLDADAAIRHVQLRQRLLDEPSAVSWLARVLGAPSTVTGTDAVVEWLEAQDSMILVIADIQMAFLRTVGGFSGLRNLMYVLNAASNKHFVICSCHRKALQYMTRLGSLVNMEVVRSVVDLSPYGEKDLQTLVAAKLEECGYTVRYDALVQQSPFGVAPEIEMRRALGRFFLLLSDASEGNPGVAMRLLTQCLTPSMQPQVLDARVAPCLGTGILDMLSDDEMFTLVALRTQGALDEPELVRVTNMSPNVVRNVVRNLLNRRLLRRDADLVKVALDQLPIVTRTLKRRHFLHFAG